MTDTPNIVTNISNDTTNTTIDINSIIPGIWTGSSEFIYMIVTWILYTIVIPLFVLLPLLQYTVNYTVVYTTIQYSILFMVITGIIYILHYTYPLLIPNQYQHIDDTPLIDYNNVQRTKVKHVLIIVHGGKTVGLRTQAQLQDILHNEVYSVLKTNNIKYDIYTTSYSNDAQLYVQNMSINQLKQYNVIISAGGDGLFSQLVNGLYNRIDQYNDIILALLPLGTGNSLMHDLKCSSVHDAVNNIINGYYKPIDINKLTDDNSLSLYSTNTVGFAIVGETAVVAESHRYLRSARYDICAVWHVLKAMKHSFVTTYNNHTNHKVSNNNKVRPTINDGINGTDTDTHIIDSNCVNVAFVNNTQHFGNGLRSAPYAKLDDGYTDLVYLLDASRVDMLKLFSLMPKGQHTNHKRVIYKQCKHVTFTNRLNNIDVITVDGEIVAYKGKLTIECIHNAIKLIVPYK